MGVTDLVNVLLSCVVVRERGSAAPFLFYIDHCFAIKGQGTVLTGAAATVAVELAVPKNIAAANHHMLSNFESC